MHVLIAILLCIVIGPSWAEEAIITDGDTLILNGILYRLDGIDAPETDQVCLDEKRNVWACGLEARDQLRKVCWEARRSLRQKGVRYGLPQSAYRCLLG